MDGRTDGPTKVHCVLQEFVPLGTATYKVSLTTLPLSAWFLPFVHPPSSGQPSLSSIQPSQTSIQPYHTSIQPFRAAAPKGSMTYAFTHMGNIFLLPLLLLLLRPTSNPSLEAQIPVSRPKSQSRDANPRIKAQILASKIKS